MSAASSLEDDLARRLADTLKRRREAAGLPQEQVALMAGISRDYLGRLESAISERRRRTPANPTLGRLEALAGALGVEVPDLIDEVYGRPPRAGSQAAR